MPVITGLTDQLLVKHFHLGWSDKRIAGEYGITVQAVSKRRTKLNLIRKPVARQVSEGLASRWTVYTTMGSDSHHNAYSMKRLREWLRWRLGDDKLSQDQIRRAKTWEERLRREDVVLGYDPDTPDGWFYRPRKPSDGRLVIDWPEDLPFPDERFRRALELPPGPGNESL
jgi:hypothetical protein